VRVFALNNGKVGTPHPRFASPRPPDRVPPTARVSLVSPPYRPRVRAHHSSQLARGSRLIRVDLLGVSVAASAPWSSETKNDSRSPRRCQPSAAALAPPVLAVAIYDNESLEDKAYQHHSVGCTRPLSILTFGATPLPPRARRLVRDVRCD